MCVATWHCRARFALGSRLWHTARRSYSVEHSASTLGFPLHTLRARKRGKHGPRPTGHGVASSAHCYDTNPLTTDHNPKSRIYARLALLAFFIQLIPWFLPNRRSRRSRRCVVIASSSSSSSSLSSLSSSS